jgi:hypothetical protein
MIHLISERPDIGLAMTGTGVVGWLITTITNLTPILGFGAALFGFIAGAITLYVKLKEFKAWRKARHKHGKKANWWQIFSDDV